MKPCKICKGSRYVTASYDGITGRPTTQEPCEACNGTGLESERLKREKSYKKYLKEKMWTWHLY